MQRGKAGQVNHDSGRAKLASLSACARQDVSEGGPVVLDEGGELLDAGLPIPR